MTLLRRMEYEGRTGGRQVFPVGQVVARVLDRPSLGGFCPVTNAVAAMAVSGAEERGAVFTRREVVEFILDLSGYTVDQPLHRFRLLEPSFGLGDFLLVAAERLLEAYFRQAPAGARTVS